MRVGLDATPLTLTSGGLPRYVAQLSVALAKEFPSHDYCLYSDQPFVPPDNSLSNLTRAAGPRSIAERRWWSWGLPKKLLASRTDVFHGTNFEVPFPCRTPAVMTIHDLSPWKNREWHQDASRVKRRTPWLLRLRAVRQIITVSEAVRRDVIRFFAFPAERVHAIPLAAASDFFRRENPRIHSRPYFLFAGTVEPRKNVPGLIAAWRMIREQTGADLLIAGRFRQDAPPLPNLEGLSILGEVSDVELAEYYTQALALVYPTLYEGFGLPVVEAMSCGCPVITSHDPAVVEVAGGVTRGAALLADSAEDLAQAMLRIGSDESLRFRQRDAGLLRARAFSWRNTARSTQQVYAEALRP